jgi:sortase A
MTDGATPARGEPAGDMPEGRLAAPDRSRRGVGARPGGGSRLHTAVRGIGQLLITAGMVVLLFVVYEVYITDIFGHEKQESATSALDSKWNEQPAPAALSSATAASGSAVREEQTTVVNGNSTKVVTVTNPNKVVADPGARRRNYQTIDGQGFAKIFVPAFGADYAFTIIEGTSTDDLYAGPGHYADTQYPGEPGNFAVAGHRVSKGSPFNQLALLASCDALVIETQSDWFVYRVLPMQNEAAGWDAAKHAHCAGVSAPTGQYARTVGREITVPSDYAQVLPVPHVSSSSVPAAAQRLITLTTCHPQFSDAERMIVHGVLVKSYPKTAGFLPPELNEG